MDNEKINIGYRHSISYLNALLNEIGSTTSQTFRTLDTISGDTAYVRKFGEQDPISDLIDISPPLANGTYKVYALDGTLLGSRVSGGAYIDAGTVSPAQGYYIDIEANGGDVVIPGAYIITLESDVYPGGAAKSYRIPQETVLDGNTLRLYLAKNQGTYYDSELKYGGRRGQTVLNQIDFPYRTIADALAALNSANDGVVVLDSESYDEEIDTTFASTIIQSSLGETPVITNGIGARTTLAPSSEYNNNSAIYFNTNGDDANPGTWQEPKKTIQAAITARGAKEVVYGGSGATQSATFEEDTLHTGGIIEPDHGYSLTMNGTQAWEIGLSGNYRNINFDGNGSLFAVGRSAAGAATVAVGIDDCTITNATNGVFDALGAGSWNIRKCNIFNVENASVLTSQVSRAVTFTQNIIHASADGLEISGSATTTLTLDIQNNIFYNHSNTAILIRSFLGGITFTLAGAIDHNTFYNHSYGLRTLQTLGTLVVGNSTDNNIFENNSINGILSDVALAADNNIFYNNVSDYNINVTSTNEILTDPKLCQKFSPFRLGISADSSAYRAASDSDDIGAIIRMIEINASGIIINGLNIDGQTGYNNGIFIADTVDHIGLTLKWCNVYDFNGIAVDLYDDDTALDCQILNCKIYNNGAGIKFLYGGNTVDECLIYRNLTQGIWINQTSHSFNNTVFWGNKYGLYIESAGSTVSILNCTFSENSLFGIFSEVSIIVTFNCIVDATENINATDPSNITDNPLFINTNEGEENFNIKTTETGFSKDSPCKGTASDGLDIGAYEVDRAVENDYWRLHPLVYNPRNIDFAHNVEGLTKFVNAQADLDLFGKDDKRQFLFKYNQRQFSDETDRKKFEYFITLMKTRINGLADLNVRFRLSFLPSQNLLNGTGTIDSDAKTITDATQDLVENEWRGFYAGVKFQTGSATGTIAGKVLTVSPSPGWDVDEWTDDNQGYYFHYQGYWYYILSNTADALTLSDPEDRLSNVSNIDWSIEKYFKVSECFEDVITLIDSDNELVSGSYDYYIGFIECVIAQPKFKYKQPRYYWQQENWKTGYQILFQEI